MLKRLYWNELDTILPTFDISPFPHNIIRPLWKSEIQIGCRGSCFTCNIQISRIVEKFYFREKILYSYYLSARASTNKHLDLPFKITITQNIRF